MSDTVRLPGPLVDAEWLAEQLAAGAGERGLLVLDATLIEERGEFPAIPGARLFDLDESLSDLSNPLPHTMPGPEQFQRELRALGLNDAGTVVVYDNVGVYSSPRCWWMLRAMGFERVAVLDGGLPAWIAAGLPQQAEPTPEPAVPGDFTARPQPDLLVDSAVVLAALPAADAAVLDARAHGRFTGATTEPRSGLRAGHMPGAVNLPFATLKDPVTGRFLPATELHAVFAKQVGDADGPEAPERMIFSCGSGITACVLALGATLAGYAPTTHLAVYDGSWSEWGLPSELPVVSGDGSASVED